MSGHTPGGKRLLGSLLKFSRSEEKGESGDSSFEDTIGGLDLDHSNQAIISRQGFQNSSQRPVTREEVFLRPDYYNVFWLKVRLDSLPFRSGLERI